MMGISHQEMDVVQLAQLKLGLIVPPQVAVLLQFAYHALEIAPPARPEQSAQYAIEVML